MNIVDLDLEIVPGRCALVAGSLSIRHHTNLCRLASPCTTTFFSNGKDGNYEQFSKIAAYERWRHGHSLNYIPLRYRAINAAKPSA